MTVENHCSTLDFRIALNSPHGRERFRVYINGLSLLLDDVEQTFNIRDISSTGCNLCAEAKSLAVGRTFDGDLHIGGAGYIAGIKVKIVRHVANNSVACIFRALTRQQEIKLDKLLLEIQKRDIATLATRRKRKTYRCRHMLR
ncbi:MAG: PilZ domain-containing protein [Deltaproteobacteria bacterium]|jgi:hypothetical protein|nr:PilZ domain-containing protein [Deltaproteobacteria bacterium]